VRRAAKIDANQRQIVAALRAVGASVRSLAAIGEGCPDLLVGYRSRNYLLEVKRDAKAKLTPEQELFFQSWRGPVYRVNSVDEALAVIGLVTTTDGRPA